MKLNLFIFIGILLSLFLCPSFAFPVTVDAKICFKYGVDYNDQADGDRYTTGSDKKAFGVYAKIRTPPTGSYVVVWEGYTTDDGANAGCINSVTLNRSSAYRIKVYAKAYLDDDNEVKVYRRDDNGTPSDTSDDFDSLHAQIVALSFTPTTGDAFEFDYDYNSTYDTSNVLAAASKVLDFRPGGISDHVFKYYTNPCPGGSHSCNRSNATYISDVGRMLKFTIAHETGHEITREANAPEGHTNDCSLGGSSHTYWYLEYQSCAAYEGFADFYAAACWNYANNTDCETMGGRDCDASHGRLDDFDPPSSNGYPGLDTLDGLGVESDWTHFWWDMHSDYGDLSVGDIVDIYVGADMEDWDTGENNDVWDEINVSATNLGFANSNWYTASGNCMVYY